MRKTKLKDLIESSHGVMNDVVLGTASFIEDADVVIKIDDLLKERGMTQQDLALMTGMRVGSVSQIINGKNLSFNKIQLAAIMVALQVSSLSELIEIRLPQEKKEAYDAASAEWTKTREMPIELKEMYRDNMIKANLSKLEGK